MALPSTPSKQVILRAENVWKSYDNNAITVLNGVDFHVSTCETVALCGPSGCGKSTLLHLLGGLDEPDHGMISANGIASRHNGDLLRLLRHEVGFVFQLHNLIPDLTLEENCLIPTVAAGCKPHDARTRLIRLAGRTGLTGRLNQTIQKLSGGERQRAALCRALMNGPRVLLADEPTGSLDDRTRNSVFEMLLELVANEGVTLVMATHDRELAKRCDRTVLMRDGKVYEAS
jgi:ABC-type lipoprotein export system ATPase subunit